MRINGLKACRLILCAALVFHDLRPLGAVVAEIKTAQMPRAATTPRIQPLLPIIASDIEVPLGETKDETEALPSLENLNQQIAPTEAGQDASTHLEQFYEHSTRNARRDPGQAVSIPRPGSSAAPKPASRLSRWTKAGVAKLTSVAVFAHSAAAMAQPAEQAQPSLAETGIFFGVILGFVGIFMGAIIVWPMVAENAALKRIDLSRAKLTWGPNIPNAPDFLKWFASEPGKSGRSTAALDSKVLFSHIIKSGQDGTALNFARRHASDLMSSATTHDPKGFWREVDQSWKDLEYAFNHLQLDYIRSKGWSMEPEFSLSQLYEYEWQTRKLEQEMRKIQQENGMGGGELSRYSRKFKHGGREDGIAGGARHISSALEKIKDKTKKFHRLEDPDTLSRLQAEHEAAAADKAKAAEQAKAAAQSSRPKQAAPPPRRVAAAGPVVARRKAAQPKAPDLEISESEDLTLAEVGGQDETVKELSRVVDYLKNPEKYLRLGAKGYKGVLLYGRPGTGKTLLARAVKAEAGAGFFSAVGSEFDQKYVGVGAARVRKLFKNAREHRGPAIVFIDEIDSFAAQRGDSDKDGGRGQTLIQLLSEMDGFVPNNVVVIAATNRPEVLDPALMRGRRFGLKLAVNMPDQAGRKAILEIHLKNTPLEGTDADVLAAQTAGLSGADIAEIVNDAAMIAGKADQETVTAANFAAALQNFKKIDKPSQKIGF